MKKSLFLLFALIMALALCLTSCVGERRFPIEISEDGYWVINGEKTDVKAEGKDGKDAVCDSCENTQGLEFYLKDDGTYAVAIGNAKYLSHIDIPETYNEKAVTEIAYLGFEDAQNLKSINIPNSVTTIGNSAFSSCSKLKDVYYTGSEEEWKAIIGSNNDYLTYATIHYNYVPEE